MIRFALCVGERPVYQVITERGDHFGYASAMHGFVPSQYAENLCCISPEDLRAIADKIEELRVVRNNSD